MLYAVLPVSCVVCNSQYVLCHMLYAVLPVSCIVCNSQYVLCHMLYAVLPVSCIVCNSVTNAVQCSLHTYMQRQICNTVMLLVVVIIALVSEMFVYEHGSCSVSRHN